MHKLAPYGADERLVSLFLSEPSLLPARVGAQHRTLYTLVTGDGETEAEVSGRFRHEAATVDALGRRLLSGGTAAFIGSSGVGKSTLINRLASTDATRVSDTGGKASLKTERIPFPTWAGPRAFRPRGPAFSPFSALFIVISYFFHVWISRIPRGTAGRPRPVWNRFPAFARLAPRPSLSRPLPLTFAARVPIIYGCWKHPSVSAARRRKSVRKDVRLSAGGRTAAKCRRLSMICFIEGGTTHVHQNDRGR